VPRRPGGDLGAGGVDASRLGRRSSRRRHQLLRLQRLSDRDHELVELQSGGVRLRRHPAAARPGARGVAAHGADRRALPRPSRRPHAGGDGAARAVEAANVSLRAVNVTQTRVNLFGDTVYVTLTPIYVSLTRVYLL